MIFAKDILAMCSICEYAKKLGTSDDMLCKYKGVVSYDYFCNKYKYDPLKRIPRKKPKLPEYEKEDFEL